MEGKDLVLCLVFAHWPVAGDLKSRDDAVQAKKDPELNQSGSSMTVRTSHAA